MCKESMIARSVLSTLPTRVASPGLFVVWGARKILVGMKSLPMCPLLDDLLPLLRRVYALFNVVLAVVQKLCRHTRRKVTEADESSSQDHLRKQFLYN